MALDDSARFLHSKKYTNYINYVFIKMYKQLKDEKVRESLFSFYNY